MNSSAKHTRNKK